jgi:hypothetical protein
MEDIIREVKSLSEFMIYYYTDIQSSLQGALNFSSETIPTIPL